MDGNSTDPKAYSSGQLPWDLLESPARDYLQWVQGRHGLDGTTACLAGLSSVLCAVGTSRRIINPTDFAFLPASLSLVLIGRIGLELKAAANLGLAPIREWICNRLSKIAGRTVGDVRLRISELHEQLILQSFLLQGLKSSSSPGAGRQIMTEEELETRKADIESQRNAIIQQLNEQAFLLTPHFLVDDTSIHHLTHPELISHDGATFHLSAGHAVVEWCNAKGNAKAELSRLLVNSWQGGLTPGDDGPSMRSLSNLIVTSSVPGRTLQTDRDLNRYGAIQELFFLDASLAGGKVDLLAEPPAGAVEQWTSGLDVLVNARMAGKTRDYELEAEATQHFDLFMKDLADRSAALGIEESRRIERGAVLSLKLALLIHVASPNRDDVKISKNTMRFAIALADVVGAGDLDIFHSFQRKAPENGSSTTDREMEALVLKLQLRGPLRWRDLLRSQHTQKSAPLEHLLEKAMKAGRVVKKDDLFYANKPPKS